MTSWANVVNAAWEFRVAPQRHHGQIRFASLLWMQFCLENGGFHRGLTFAIKRTTLTGWKFFFKIAASIGGCHLQLKKTILTGWTISHIRVAFCLLSEVGDASEAPPGQTLNANWVQNHLRVDSEPTLRRTLNMIQLWKLQPKRWGSTRFTGDHMLGGSCICNSNLRWSEPSLVKKQHRRLVSSLSEEFR